MSNIDNDKKKEWLEEQKEHLRDYAAPYTEKIQPVVDDIKFYADPVIDHVKEKTEPVVEKVRTNIEAIRIEREQKTEDDEVVVEDNDYVVDKNKFNRKNIMIAAIAIIVIVAFIVGIMLGRKVDDDLIPEPTEIIEETIGDVYEDEAPTSPTEPRKLVNEENRPTFMIDGIEYEFDCEFGELLKDDALKISDIDVYLHYNKKALIVPAGWTRTWDVEAKDGKTLSVTIRNDTESELTSELCRVVMIEVSGKGDEIDMSLVSGKIKLGMPAKDIVDILGSVSGTKEENGIKTHWWNWRPYKNNTQKVYIRVNANSDGNVTAMRFETNTK